MPRTRRDRDVTLHNGLHGRLHGGLHGRLQGGLHGGPSAVRTADERSGGDGVRPLAGGRAGARRGERKRGRGRGRVLYWRRPRGGARRFGSLDDAALLFLPRRRVGCGEESGDGLVRGARCQGAGVRVRLGRRDRRELPRRFVGWLRDDQGAGGCGACRDNGHPHDRHRSGRRRVPRLGGRQHGRPLE
ncbi:hypothetical protein [Streptomyces sp. NPDC051677]|uniref:hypothetical protein n=1 Tax=Streptomyces sp. NPDC051677 TaxID=3365669 RepID=UPI0037CE9D1C